MAAVFILSFIFKYVICLVSKILWFYFLIFLVLSLSTNNVKSPRLRWSKDVISNFLPSNSFNFQFCFFSPSVNILRFYSVSKHSNIRCLCGCKFVGFFCCYCIWWHISLCFLWFSSFKLWPLVATLLVWIPLDCHWESSPKSSGFSFYQSESCIT